jgi:hypothetical protein
MFAMNIVPISICRSSIFPRYGFALVYFFTLYLVLTLLFELVKPYITSKIHFKTCITSVSFHIIVELLFIIGSIALVYFFMPDKYKHVTESDTSLSLAIPFEAITYIFYVVFFNAVTFLTMEYGLAIFKEEYKKNYTKYYFKFENDFLRRFVFILQNAVPQVLSKIRKSLTWLVSFMIVVEAIFEIKEGVGSFDLFVEGDYITVLLVIRDIFITLCIIDTIIDCIISSKKTDGQKEEKTNSWKEEKVLGIRIRFNQKIVLSVSALLVICAGLFVYNIKMYPIVGYYDFALNQEHRHVLEGFIEDQNLFVNPNLDIQDKTFCKESKNGYALLECVIEIDGKKTVILPFYDRAEGYGFIQNNTYRSQETLPMSAKLVALQEKTLNAANGKLINFRLPFDTEKAKSRNVPFSLVLPFYLFYFLILGIIVVLITYLFYHFVYNSVIGVRSSSRTIKIIRAFVLFLNAITLVILIFIVNKYMEIRLMTKWRELSFVSSMLSFAAIQFVITLMFSDNYIDEIKNSIEKIMSSQEFNYYRMIAVDSERQFTIFSKKYGNKLLLRICIQNLLLVFNINWFISYAFNIWDNFTDSIGITYSIGLENIITKLVTLNRAGLESYSIFIILYGMLLIAYLVLQYRENKKNGL